MKTTFIEVLKNRHFLKVWSSQGLSQLTANMLNFVLIVKIYEATQSTVAVGLFLAIYAAPSVFLGLFSGAFIDLMSKRKVLLLTNLSQALVVLLYLGIGNKIWPIYTIVLLYSLCDEFYTPAEASSIPALVKKDNLPAANSLFLFTLHGAFILGYTIAGPIIKFFNAQAPFLLACLFNLMAGWAVFFLPKDKPRKGLTIETSFEDIVKDIKDGYSFIKNEPKVLIPIILYVSFQIIIASAVVLLPAYAHQILSMDIRDAGILLVLPAGIGALLGAFFVERTIKKLGKRLLMTSGIFVASLGLMVMALIAPRIGLAIPLSSFLMIVLGVGMVMVTIPAQTLLQENTPFDVRGRVFGALGAFVAIAAALPLFVVAGLTDIFGPVVILLVIALILFVGGLLSLKKEYVLRIYYRPGNTR
jgi:MFS family permease